MSGIAVLCSGQGNQHAAMFDALAGRQEPETIFTAAKRILGGRDPRDLVKQATSEEIHQNHTAQILSCTHALAWWAVLQSSLRGPLVAAGYSVGEVSAWNVAGAIAPAKTLEIAARRAALMDEETRAPSGLAAIVGLSRKMVDELIRDTSIEIAIIDGPSHFILGGLSSDLRKLRLRAEQCGAKRATLLPVTVPSHTSALDKASHRFRRFLREELADVSFPGGVRLISSIDAEWVRDIEIGADKLAAQLSTTIDWSACMDACCSRHPSCIIELGPGDAMVRMIAEIAPDIPARSVSAFHSPDGVVQWLSETR